VKLPAFKAGLAGHLPVRGQLWKNSRKGFKRIDENSPLPDSAGIAFSVRERDSAGGLIRKKEATLTVTVLDYFSSWS